MANTIYMFSGREKWLVTTPMAFSVGKYVYIIAGSRPMETSWLLSHLIPIRDVTTTSWRAEGFRTASYQTTFISYFLFSLFSLLSKLIVSLSVQKRKTKDKTSAQQKKRVYSIWWYHQWNSTTYSLCDRYTRCNRQIQRHFLQEGSGKISSHVRNIKQAHHIHQRRHGNSWMVNW